MVEFSRLITTKKGQALNAKMIAGTGLVQFTKVCTSDHEYGLNELENLTGLEGIRQTIAPSRITRTNEVGVKIETVFSNYNLKTGYYMRTLGLYASDPDEEEILYAAAVSVSDQCYMPPNSGITSSAAYINLIYAVGNSDNVSLNVDPGCFATIGDLKEIREQIGKGMEMYENLQNLVSGNINAIRHLSNVICSYSYCADIETISCIVPHSYAAETLQFPAGMAYMDGESVVLASCSGSISDGNTGTGTGTPYALPIATEDTLGGVKIGPGIKRLADGTISVDTAGVAESVSGQVAESAAEKAAEIVEANATEPSDEDIDGLFH